MSKIEDDVKNAIEEFGDRAHERFIVTCNYGDYSDHIQEHNQSLLSCLDDDSLDIRLKPIAELFAHDIEAYGDNAYVMWEISLSDKDNFINTTDNRDVEWALNSTNYDVIRKLSVAREFYLEDAKAGDVVEMLKNGEWLTGKLEMSEHGFFIFHGKNFGTGGSLKNAELRMKYPKKVQS